MYGLCRVKVAKVHFGYLHHQWYSCKKFRKNNRENSVQNILSSSLPSKNLKIKIYRTIILRVVLYGCETWYLILREERRLRVLENRVLRRIFGPKRDEVMGMEKTS